MNRVLIAAFLFAAAAARADVPLKLIDDDARECVSRAQIESISKSFPQFVPLAKRAKICGKDGDSYSLLKTLIALDEIRFSSIEHSGDDLVRGVLPGAHWSEYFKTHVKTFASGEKDGSCKSGYTAYINRGKSPSTMYHCDDFFAANVSFISRIEVLLHEASHLEKSSPHVDCTQGLRKGQRRSCDESADQRWAYSVSMETHAQVGAYAINVHPATKDISKSLAIGYAFDVFNKTPNIVRSKVPLLLAENGDLEVLAGGKVITKQRGLGSGVLVTIGETLPSVVVFPTGSMQSPSMFTSSFEPVLLDYLETFVHSFVVRTPDQRSLFRGYHSGKNMVARIYVKEVAVNCRRGDTILAERWSSGGERLIGTVYPDGVQDNDLVEVVAESGRSVLIGCDEKGGFRANWYSARREPMKMARIGQESFALRRDGQFLVRRGSEWQTLPETAQERFSDFSSFDWVEFYQRP